MIDRSDMVFFGVLATGLLAVLVLDHRALNARELSAGVPNENVNENPEGLATDGRGPMRDANLPLRRQHAIQLPQVGIM